MSYKVTCRDSCHRNPAHYNEKYEGRGMKYTPTLLTATKTVCCITLAPDRNASGQTMRVPAGDMWRPPGLFWSGRNKWGEMESQFWRWSYSVTNTGQRSTGCRRPTSEKLTNRWTYRVQANDEKTWKKVRVVVLIKAKLEERCASFGTFHILPLLEKNFSISARKPEGSE